MRPLVAGTIVVVVLIGAVISTRPDAQVTPLSKASPTQQETRSTPTVSPEEPSPTPHALADGWFVSADEALRFRAPEGWRAWDKPNNFGGQYVHIGVNYGGDITVLTAELATPHEPDCEPEPNTGDVKPFVCEWVTINGSRWHRTEKIVEGQNHVIDLVATRQTTSYRIILHAGSLEKGQIKTVLSSIELAD